jgi:hypothetical protein
MTQRRVVPALLLVLAALLFVAAGCGGSSDEGTDEAVVETSADTGEETMDHEEMTDEEEMTDTTGDTGALSAFASEDCAQLATIGASIAQAVDPSGNFDADEASQLYEQLAEKAPAEIQDDLAVFANYLGEIADALQGVDLSSGQAPSPEAAQKLQALSNTSPEVQQAANHLSDWASENCTTGG